MLWCNGPWLPIRGSAAAIEEPKIKTRAKSEGQHDTGASPRGSVGREQQDRASGSNDVWRPSLRLTPRAEEKREERKTNKIGPRETKVETPRQTKEERK